MKPETFDFFDSALWDLVKALIVLVAGFFLGQLSTRIGKKGRLKIIRPSLLGSLEKSDGAGGKIKTLWENKDATSVFYTYKAYLYNNSAIPKTIIEPHICSDGIYHTIRDSKTSSIVRVITIESEETEQFDCFFFTIRGENESYSDFEKRVKKQDGHLTYLTPKRKKRKRISVKKRISTIPI